MTHDRENLDTLTDEAGRLVDSDPGKALILASDLYRRAQKVDYVRGQAAALRCMGAAHLHLTHHDEGLSCLTQALELSVACGDRMLEARCIHVFGVAAHMRSEIDAAIKHYMAALRIFTELNALDRGVVTLNNLGAAFQLLGDHEAALKYLEQALEITKRSGDNYNLALPLQNIAGICLTTGNFERALACLDEALDFSVRTGNSRNEATTLAQLSLAHLKMNRDEQARKCAVRALHLAVRLGLKLTEAEAMCLIARIHARQNDLGQAIELFKRALRLVESIAQGSQLADSLIELGNLYFQIGDFVQARAHWNRASAIAESTRLRPIIGAAQKRLAELSKIENDYYSACRHLEIAHQAERQIFTQKSASREKALMIQMDLDRTRRESELHRIEAEHRRQEAEAQRENLFKLQQLNSELNAVNQELAETNQRLEQLATTDLLTGLKNRRYGHERLIKDFEHARRCGEPLSVLLLDVDHFKVVNDTYGHAAGDEVLKNVAQRIASRLTEDAMVARWGGEEFLILIPVAGMIEALITAERIRAAVEDDPMSIAGVTVSIGAATLGSHTHSPDGLVHIADEALLHSKSTGRNRVTHYNQLVLSGR